MYAVVWNNRGGLARKIKFDHQIKLYNGKIYYTGVLLYGYNIAVDETREEGRKGT